MSYEGRNHYQNSQVASAYDQAYHGRLTLANVRPRVVDWGEKRALRRLAAHLPSDCEIIDLACGTGRISEFWLIQGYSVVSSDISEQMMALAAQRLTTYPTFRGLCLGDAENTPFESGSADCVSVVRLLQRVPKERHTSMLREFARISRKWVIVSFATESGYIRMLNFVKALVFRPHPLRTHSAGVAEFVKCGEEAGLRAVEIVRTLPAISEEVFVCFRKR